MYKDPLEIEFCDLCNMSLTLKEANRSPNAAGQVLCADCFKDGPVDPSVPIVDAGPKSEGAYEFSCPHCSRGLERSVRKHGEIILGEEYECHRCDGGFLLTSVTARAKYRQILKDAARLRKEKLGEKIQDHLRKGTAPQDKIAILGRPQSGKTVYLAALYRELWENFRRNPEAELRGKAAMGPDHKALLSLYEEMCRGEWPAATLSQRDIDLTIFYKERELTLTTMDYPGEVYRQVFFEHAVSQPEQQALFEQVDSAMGVILLVDPLHLVENPKSMVDIEYSCLAVIDHLKTKKVSNNVLLLLTKLDQNKSLLEHAGGVKKFLQKHLPSIINELPNVGVISMKSVNTQSNRDESSQTSPKTIPDIDRDSRQPQLLVPLLKVLERVPEDHWDLLEGFDDERGAQLGELE